jgi:molecular chaperone HtpG
LSTREFKTESKQLLNLMINSIYTHKEIFLRELISNASDAIDKYNYLALTDDSLPKVDQHQIQIVLNKDNRSISIIDNGIGMTEEELVENLGTIAKSGSKAFIEKLKASQEEKNGSIDIIGQFGVGFYSAFMVGSKVVVKTKSPYANKAYVWASEGEETYSIEETQKTNHGTEITIFLRDDEEDQYNDYLEEWKIKELVKKYSDYVRYPIVMLVTKTVPNKDNKDEKETIQELETLNSMTPIWKKSKSEVDEKELNQFYQYQYHDYEDPMKVIQMNIEGMLNYTALIFIPKRAPQDLYSDKYEKGLQLYSKGVFIMDKCKELVPDYLRFIKGLVDSPDLSLNISREILQHNRQLTKIAGNLEKKIKNELERMLQNNREQYIEFYETYGVNLKYGCYDQFGAKKDLLKDLLLFISSSTKEFTTLKEYVERMKEDQEFIYYASGSDKKQLERLPQMELLREKGYEVLFFTDEIDEFAISMLMEYNEKQFKNISSGDLNLESEEEKEQLEEKAKEHKKLIKFLKESLKDKVSDVKLSSRLKDSAVCLVSKEGLSLEMEKVLAAMPGANSMMKAEKVLEINPNHDLFKSLERLYEKDKKQITDYADLLYSQALLIEGFKLEDPIEFSNKMCKLMIESTK